ncbi:hypothetical protein MNBD_BACTEROID03-874 [hydrothermal vent metagenome]|uniref:Glycosyl hydrolase family 13 catalytic domain-containing protein n=1 Tax=hydrothermal vent metagenome TaxID=652676 RepID=A0A3B0T1L5_9ZZZZ
MNLSENSGFTKVEPWLKVNKNHTEGINVSSQETDKNSVLNHFRAMVGVKKIIMPSSMVRMSYYWKPTKRLTPIPEL